jgi:phenylpyruvate tautomerase
MPYLKIQANKVIDDKATQDVLKKASGLVARILGKPEEYVMVNLRGSSPMLFAGGSEPVAFLELRAIGLPADKTSDLSLSLCELMESELGIPKDRIFINFVDVPAHLWGWNGETF